MRHSTFLLSLMCLFLGSSHGLIAADLDAELRDLSAMRKGKQTDFPGVDHRGAQLVQAHSDPEELGRIYYQLADIHAQGGMAHPDRVIGYAQKALDYPLDPSDKERLYVYWGDALQLANPSQPFPERRRAAATPYLEGLRALLEYNLPEKAPALPGVSMFDADPDHGPTFEALQRKHDQEVAARNLAVVQRDMIKHREVLTGQIAALYGRRPYATDEIKDLAERTLNSSAAVERLMDAVDAQVKLDAERNPPAAAAPPASPGSAWLRWSLTLASIVVLLGALGVFMFLRRRKRQGSVGK